MELLKDRYNATFFDHLSQDFKAYDPNFDQARFEQLIFDANWEQKELKDRMRHISQSLHNYYGEQFEKNVALFKQVIAHREGQDLEKLFFPDYVESYGINHLTTSLDALEAFTPYSSAEFAIRPFLVQYEAPTLERMYAWSEHENYHVRRLASEGCRPRLPWGMALKSFKKDPKPILPILEKLKDDPTDYVRRSVANNLNDISKDHPDLVLDMGYQWKGQSKGTDWIIKHAFRGLLKKGHPKALQLFGFAPPEAIEVQSLDLSPDPIAIGGDLHFSFELINHNPEPALLRLEYVIDYVKKTGKTSPKVFQISENTYDPGTISISKKQSFLQRTTRTHYPGTHQLSIVVNGIPKISQKFELVE